MSDENQTTDRVPLSFTVSWADSDAMSTTYNNVTGSGLEGSFLTLVREGETIIINMDEVRVVRIDEGVEVGS